VNPKIAVPDGFKDSIIPSALSEIKASCEV
jgi:hypothetical protein